MLSEATFMIGNNGVVNDDVNASCVTLDDCISMSVFRRNGISIGFMRRFRELVDTRVFTNARLGKNGRKGPQFESLDFESRLNGLTGGDDARGIVIAERAQEIVDLIERFHVRHRQKKVVLDEAVESLDPAFLVALGWCSELDAQHETGAKLRELAVSNARPAAQDAIDGGAGVVEDAFTGYASKGLARFEQAVAERRTVLGAIAPGKPFRAVAQPSDKHVQRRLHAADTRDHVFEVELHLIAGCVRQTHEDLFRNDECAPRSNVVACGALAYAKGPVNAFA